MATENIVLGSGKIYIAELETDGSIPTDLILEANNVGDVSGGAELAYKPTIYDVENDEGDVRKSFITKEEVTLKSGLLTWNLENINKLSVGGTYNDTTKTLTIGGNKTVKQYAIAFVHEADFADIQVIMKGSNTSGFSIKFDKAKETVIDATFTAVKNASGVLVTIKEVVAPAG